MPEEKLNADIAVVVPPNTVVVPPTVLVVASLACFSPQKITWKSHGNHSTYGDITRGMGWEVPSLFGIEQSGLLKELDATLE